MADKLILKALIAAVAIVCVQSSAVFAKDVGTDSHSGQSPDAKSFTTPSIRKVLTDLHALDPIPLSAVQRDAPDFLPPNRVSLAMGFGELIADGFLNVDAKNNDALVPIERALRKYARSLGVGKAFAARASSLANLAHKERWADLEEELITTQECVEKAMKSLHDEDLAHLVSLGGWIRALQITSTICAKWPSPERLALLKRPEMASYFIEVLESLPHSLAQRRITARTINTLKELHPLLEGPFTPERVRKIQEITMSLQAALDQHWQ